MNIEFIDKIILRTPVGSIDDLKPIGEIKDISTDGLNFVEKTFTGHFRLALLYATKNLFEEITRALEARDLPEKMFFSYIKYYVRYCSRSTPFGLFSTYGVCDLKESNDPFSVKIEESEICMRISLSYIYELSREINSSKNLWKYSFLYPNQTAYGIGEDIRYNELYIKPYSMNYRLSSVATNDVLEYIFSESGQGIYFEDLSEKLQAEGYESDEVEEYLYELIENNVLLMDIFPSPATNNYVEAFVEKLKKIKDNGEIITIKEKQKTINQIIDEVTQLQAGLKGVIKESEAGTSEKLENLLLNEMQNIDVTSFRNGEAEIGSKVFHNVRNTLLSLSYLNSRRKEKDPSLTGFIDEFKDKYGESELPLLHVIDPELGIFTDRVSSISTPFLDGILFQTGGGKDYKFTEIDEYLFSKYQHALQFGKSEVVLTKDECSKFKPSYSRVFSQTLNCNMTLFKDQQDNTVTAIHGAFGSSAVNNMGRFTHGSEKLQKLAEKIVEIEYSNLHDSVEYAEIVDLPSLRHGNLVVRENYLKDEILINIPAPSDTGRNTIKLSDITISVRSEEVILRNKNTGKIIVPRLSNSHNFQLQNLSHIYRFLSLIQVQWDCSISFSWGFIESFAKFTPRVKIEKVIVKEAAWNLNQTDLTFLKAKEENLFSEFKKFKEEWKIPDRVYLVEGDNKLLFDLSSEVFIRLLVSMISKKGKITLVEDLVKENINVHNTDNKPFYSELIIPVIIQDEKQNFQFNDFSESKAKLSPLSECLYMNIYTGEQQMDSLLKNELFELNGKLFEKDLISNCFFIRYNENGTHIRLRYFIKNYEVYNDLFAHMREAMEKYIEQDIIKAFEITTYKRELERYEYAGIEFTETYFGKESTMVMLLMRELEEIGFEERWLAGTVFIDKLLNKFAYTLDGKIEFFTQLSSQFNQEFNSNKGLTKVITAKYKTSEQSIHDSIGLENKELTSIYTLFDSFLNSFSLDGLLSEKDKQDRSNYVGSLIHMFFNRLLVSQHRKQELVIYNFMLKFYKTQLNKTNVTKEIPVL
ncbi:thiopeptide-type bacteriocin biosynthesis protein [Chryseobacterium sp. 52]|uniref:lantibiotic dehydratase n=1 Tax=Chryseobacterium sp. 52 TaxID=2035213 RepID=UPI000C19F2D1|nr:lantibiotic dehydratase [Chryseobacterium sp. 52]PIF45413.1 thiopeptide-type bacteriocin biosynthesis protein [Chryseobacterium sp. 52]